MDALPLELVEQIIAHVPKESLPSCRLVCRTFNNIAFPILFSHIPHWLDYKRSHQAVLCLVNDVMNRPSVLWSPWASEPDGPVTDIWMAIVWRVLMKIDPPSSEISSVDEGEEGKGIRLTPHNFAELSGNEEMSEKRLRTAQNRFLMHRSYSGKFDWGGKL